MVVSVKPISKGSEVLGEWISSIKRRPLQKGVARFVTIVKDDVTSVLGREDNFLIAETSKANGISKMFVKIPDSSVFAKKYMYPDGSWSATCYSGKKPVRTNGAFILKKKTGEKLVHQYGYDGYITPEEAKTIHMSVLDTLGKPNNEVDLREIFGRRPKSKILRFFGDIKYKVGNFFKKFNKQNTAWREYAKSIDRNA